MDGLIRRRHRLCAEIRSGTRGTHHRADRLHRALLRRRRDGRGGLHRPVAGAQKRKRKRIAQSVAKSKRMLYNNTAIER